MFLDRGRIHQHTLVSASVTQVGLQETVRPPFHGRECTSVRFLPRDDLLSVVTAGEDGVVRLTVCDREIATTNQPVSLLSWLAVFFVSFLDPNGLHAAGCRRIQRLHKYQRPRIQCSRAGADVHKKSRGSLYILGLQYVSSCNGGLFLVCFVFGVCHRRMENTYCCLLVGKVASKVGHSQPPTDHFF